MIENNLVGDNNESPLAIEVKKSSLIRGIARVCSVVERRNVIPILANVMLVAKNNILTLVATDMDILVCETIEVKILAAGSITVGAHVLYDIVRKLDDNAVITLNFVETGSMLNVVSGKSSFMLPTLPVVDFPKIDLGEYDHEFTMAKTLLQQMIDRCKFAISQEETRYNLNGAYLEHDVHGIRMVATDGHRLCLVKGHIEGVVPAFKSVLIPRKTVMEIRKIIDDYSDDVTVSLSANKIKVAGRSFAIVSKLIDAVFPEYETLIPRNNEVVVKLNTQEFYAAVDRVATVTSDKFKGIKFLFKEGILLMSASSDTIGGAKEEVQLQTAVSSLIELGLNSRYILDCMGVIEGDEVIFSMKDSFAPVIIHDNSKTSFQYIVMPMRI